MKVAAWNIRGFNKSLKQGGVQHLLRHKDLQVMALLETKLTGETLDAVMQRRFSGMGHAQNFHLSSHGRILLLWNEQKAMVEVLGMTEQYIHCRACCRVSRREFLVTFVYGLHTIVARRKLWESLMELGEDIAEPWLIMGDFNSILSIQDKQGGSPITNYEMRDFQSFAQAHGLVDLRSIGCHLTWTNGTVSSKLDRAMVNSQWLMADFDAYAEFMPPGCLSDHSCGIVHTLAKDRPLMKSFKFLNMWTMHEDFKRIVADSWATPVIGNAQFVLKTKLLRLKGRLRVLNKEHFGHIADKARRANMALEEMQRGILEGRPPPADYGSVKKQATLLAEAERQFYQQRAKNVYLRNSDRCTKFFHALVKRNNKRNAIITLIKRNGDQTTSLGEVAEEFVDYFHTLLGQHGPCSTMENERLSGRKLTHAQSEGLVRPVGDEEIRAALYDIGSEKAPGPDGYGAKFFTSTWEIVGKEFIAAAREFFQEGKLLKQWNHSLISLVPKTDHAPGVTDYRPISCCNVFYKVIAKVLAGRLALVLGYLLDPAQAAFVQGRSIGDNINLTQELLRKYARKRISPRCMLKVDLKKAFDMVNWEFLMAALRGFGFPHQYCAWIKECVSTVSYSISLNGGTYGFFGGKRGLRQGDPLSPLLFGLCIEVLSRRLQVVSTLPSFHFHPRCKEVGITHLAYADDLILVARADESSVKLLADCLEQFGREAGLQANPLKSRIYMAGTDASMKEKLLQITGFQEGDFPFRYLGIPLTAERMRIANYGPLLDAITKRMNAWPKHTLSYAGRLELVTTVLQGMAGYWFSMLPIPGGVIKKIRGICRKFVWNSVHPPISWSTLCLPKQEGGYGLRDLNAWNKALLSKKLWEIQSKADSLWVRWVHQYYIRTTNFWHWEVKTSDSPLVKRLTHIRTMILEASGGAGAANMKMIEWFASEKKGTAKAYEFFKQRGPRVDWMPVVWRPDIMPKHRFIMWLLAHNKLRTADRMSYAESKVCVLCQHQEESNEHLFFECEVTVAVWHKVKQWLEIRYEIRSVADLFQVFLRHYKGDNMKMKARHLGISCMIYVLWEARNKCRHEGAVPAVERMFRKIQIHVYRFMGV